MDSYLSDPIAELLTTYIELNPSTVTVLDEAPSALEFMRFVSLNRPFVVRGFALDPWEESQPFPEFVDFVSQQELRGRKGEEVRYAQTPTSWTKRTAGLNETPGQRLSLQDHLMVNLNCDAERMITFAMNTRRCLLMWRKTYLSPGNSHSVTSLHKDPYQNIYVQIIGQKHFTLLPPIFHSCINEVSLASSSYIRSNSDTSILTMEPDSPPTELPIATWDPDVPSKNPTKYSFLAQPIHVTLEKGDMLYLPALWYHKVGQSCGDEGICVAANYCFAQDLSTEKWIDYSDQRKN
ncbi:hypothetical protein SS1G_03120 [Sclerotinia sclerotiorum 1980 UF-70]|uniref:JmjC domain-containing protein n=1 Tax=Sclerotinia sclerotiorum (strain ATCC 18683 / 1980 / Ss-1) TaxID=665079 RepID=A7ECT1_SCLS1|nr:hypothetical protein SS1G_03120 [Sclerotinia sclerotiorum 1980 UF-70]EDO00647.1 hypothetical protein SS1G_03120 [Sclerotinia sclerotiorum 1980 UF-70]